MKSEFNQDLHPSLVKTNTFLKNGENNIQTCESEGM